MQFDFTVTPGGGQGIEVRGTFVKYVAGAGKIRVRITSGAYIDLMPGQGARGLNFERLIIEDRTGNGGFGTILAGAFEFQDDRISGDVSIIDGGKNRTIAGQTFLMAASWNPAGVMPISELWNPPGSGKNVIIESWLVSSANASNIFTGWTPTRIGTGGAGVLPKKAGGLNSVSLHASPTAASVPADYKVLTTINVQANQAATFAPKEPVVIPPGFGFFCININPGNGLQNVVEFFEEAL